jgi:hypothetical protein
MMNMTSVNVVKLISIAASKMKRETEWLKIICIIIKKINCLSWNYLKTKHNRHIGNFIINFLTIIDQNQVNIQSACKIAKPSGKSNKAAL